MGADNLRTFHRWKDPQGILSLARLVILNRPGFDKNYPKRWPYLKINMPAVDISSSDIRQRLKTKKSIWYLTPKAVIRYIKRYRLYGYEKEGHMSDIKSQIKFGTDGWRAVISDTFTFENVRIVAQAVADWVNKNNPQFLLKVRFGRL